MEAIYNKFIYKENLVFSLEPLSSSEILAFTNKTKGDNQLRKNIILLNEDIESAFEFKSEREMARFFNISSKLIRKSIMIGKFKKYKIICKYLSFRLCPCQRPRGKKIYVLDSNTLNVLYEFNSITEAMKSLKIGFYILKNLLSSQEILNGKIYSYTNFL